MNPSATWCKRTTQGTRSWTPSDACRQVQPRGWSCCIQVSLNDSIRYERRLMPLYLAGHDYHQQQHLPARGGLATSSARLPATVFLPVLKVDYLHCKKAPWGDRLYTTSLAAPPSSSAWFPADGVQCALHGSQLNIPVSSSSNQVECRSPLCILTLLVHLLILPLQDSTAPYWAAP